MDNAGQRRHAQGTAEGAGTARHAHSRAGIYLWPSELATLALSSLPML